MFFSCDHFNHLSSWLFALPGHCDAQCLSCLINAIENTTLSAVQRQVYLSVVKSAVEDNNDVIRLLMSHFDVAAHLLDLMAESYTDQPYRETAVAICANVITHMVSEDLYDHFMDICHYSVYVKAQENSIHFSLLVLVQLCNKCNSFPKMILCAHVDTVIEVLERGHMFEEDTLCTLSCLLFHLVKTLRLERVHLSDPLNVLIWRILDAQALWLSNGHSKSLQASCLALVKETLEFTDMNRGLLLLGLESPDSPSLLLGLKRMLSTKDSELVSESVKCLDIIVSRIGDSKQVKEVLDTDVAEFVFESLHTTNSSLLNVVFDCLTSMAAHQVFYDRCHAVYGIESCLLAIREALDASKFGVVEKGLDLVICLLDRQPENMPLFVNQSWNLCAQVLMKGLCHEKPNLLYRLLRASALFCRPHHQQNHVDIKSLVSLLRTTLSTVEQYLNSQTDSTKDTSGCILCNVMDVTINVHSLCQSRGQDLRDLEEFEDLVSSICHKLVLPLGTVERLSAGGCEAVEKYLACINILLTSNYDRGIDRAVHMVASGFPWHILACLSLSQVSEDVRMLGAHLITDILQSSHSIVLMANLDKEALSFGFARLHWRNEGVLQSVKEFPSKEETVALLILCYLSHLHGCTSIKYQAVDPVPIIHRTVMYFPDLTSLGDAAVKAFVFLHAVSQISEMSDGKGVGDGKMDSCVLTHLEKLNIEQWATLHPAVFIWVLDADGKKLPLAHHLVEYWLLTLPPRGNDLEKATEYIYALKDGDDRIFQSVRHNIHFLMCLLFLLKTKCAASVADHARDLFVYSVSILGDDKDSSRHSGSLCQTLLQNCTNMLEFVSCQLGDGNADISCGRILAVLCALLECPLLPTQSVVFKLKPVLCVVRLIGSLAQENPDLEHSLQYLALLSSRWTLQESRAVIPPMLENQGFVRALQASLTSTCANVSRTGLSLVAWLCVNGSQYQPVHCLEITTRYLLTTLVTCDPCHAHPLLQLLQAALVSSCGESETCGVIKFVRKLYNFTIYTHIFTVIDLRQIYVYLQQFVLQNNDTVRLQTVHCMEELLASDENIRKWALSQPWNGLMLESALVSRSALGLTQAEVDLCFLFSSNDMVSVLSHTAAKSYLLALCESDLQPKALGRAAQLFEQIRPQMCENDQELMETVEHVLKRSSS